MSNIDHIEEAKIQKLKELREKGVSPYGFRFDTDTKIADLHENFVEGREATVAGRVMAFRAHGKSIFMDLTDSSGKIQLYAGMKVLGEELFEVAKRTDIGDIIGIKGELFKTRTEENTLKVHEITMLSKALLPLPEKFHGLKDVETRYRKRYLDLIVNEEVKNKFKIRSKIVSKIRNILDSDDFLEVETPMMHPIAGGAAGKPFVTHHDTLHTDLFLRIAPELYLKKLLVGGFEKIYEMNRTFRNEGISVRHNPEFTMLEVYQAFSDCQGMMDLTEKIVRTCAKEILGTEKLTYMGKEIDLTKWEKVSFAKLMKDKFGIQPQDDTKTWIEKLKASGMKLEGDKLGRTQLINIVGELVEPQAGNHPVFVVDMFTEMCPLAKANKDNPLLSDRFELYMGGMEIANAYSELNDPIEQRERFQAQEENYDEGFVEALEYGMPPAGGLGIGIDRLVMILTDSANIRDVILFPQMKPIKKDKDSAVDASCNKE